ncbi:MAG: CDGSH iron-sulfur domain-containing protein [Bacteroidetes bacterium HGW-Bacteroidetes-15]|nr:MAG: CDGSH iron-sulfur domain-containing protein [Bacteroidetes bacterium HGW-Bacteroidetes-15]
MSESNQDKQTVITISKGGPIKVNGLFTITAVNGDKIEPKDTHQVYLCACGRSKNKPFCDGSHNRINP